MNAPETLAVTSHPRVQITAERTWTGNPSRGCRETHCSALILLFMIYLEIRGHSAAPYRETHCSALILLFMIYLEIRGHSAAPSLQRNPLQYPDSTLHDLSGD
ncbi:UNVERIFIED_CONTAM: hypothetical protein FKN15_020883 [Acipenser sinensis]